MKILHIILSLGVGGTERMVSDLICNDHSGDCQHTVCCLEGIGVFGDKLIEQGIKVVHVSRRPGKDWRLIFKLAKLIYTQKVDIVHTHGETPWFYGALAAKVAFFSSAKCITTVHGYGGGDRTHVDDFKLWRFLSKITKKIVVVADNLRTELLAAGFSDQKVTTILNGVDSQQQIAGVQKRSQWSIGEDDFVVGIIARLSPIKNHALLIDAFAKMVKFAPIARLMIVGDGPERASLETLVNDRKITHNVIFCGEQLQADSFYPLFDVFVLPSFSEGISMTLLEASAAKLPLVASAVGGNCEIITDGKNGLLFPSGDVDALYQHLQKLLDSVALREKLAAHGFKSVVEKFDLQRMIQQYVALYTSLSGR